MALSFRTETLDGPGPMLDVTATALVMAGWAGRDAAALRHHVAELAALGVKPPRRMPCAYRLSPALLSQAAALHAIGGASSGEVEYVLVQHQGRLWIGVGSDHTDRALEVHGITASKQVCGKPVAAVLWPFEEVAPHWDRLRLHAEIDEGGRMATYQSGPLAALLPPTALRDQLFDGAWPEGLVLFGGTLPAIGGIRPAGRFSLRLEDPVLGRAIGHAYDIIHLPIEE